MIGSGTLQHDYSRKKNYSKRYFKKIDYVFHNVHKIREAVRDARADRGAVEKNGSGVGDPTAAQAMRDIMPLKSVEIDGEPLEKPEAWLQVVDAVYGWCDFTHTVIMADKYAGEDYRRTCVKLSISQSTHSKYWHDIREWQRLATAQAGVIRYF